MSAGASSKRKHAKSAFSGEGARIFEGRWNSAGVRVVYCSENLALAALEILVHTQPVMIRDKFRAFRATWDESLMTTMDLKKLPKGWNAQPPGPISKISETNGFVPSARLCLLSQVLLFLSSERFF